MREKVWMSAAAVRSVLAIAALLTIVTGWAAEQPAIDKAATGLSTQTAVLAGGCFWGVDAVFKHVKGVIEVESGYAGGKAATAHYEMVSRGDTGQAEAVRIRFNPAQVSYRQLLEIFFTVAHDPTQLNRQGPDVGSQYRSAIFFSDAEQQQLALDTVQRLKAARVYSKPIVTQIVSLQQFFPAESYHQNYLALHPEQPYIVFNDLPKLVHLRQKYPDFYQ